MTVSLEYEWNSSYTYESKFILSLKSVSNMIHKITLKATLTLCRS